MTNFFKKVLQFEFPCDNMRAEMLYFVKTLKYTTDLQTI